MIRSSFPFRSVGAHGPSSAYGRRPKLGHMTATLVGWNPGLLALNLEERLQDKVLWGNYVAKESALGGMVTRLNSVRLDLRQG